MLARPHGWPAAVAVEKHGLSPAIRGCQSAALGRTRLDAFGARAVSPESRESWERGGARRDRVSPMRPARGRSRRGLERGAATAKVSARFPVGARPSRPSLGAFPFAPFSWGFSWGFSTGGGASRDARVRPGMCNGVAAAPLPRCPTKRADAVHHHYFHASAKPWRSAGPGSQEIARYRRSSLAPAIWACEESAREVLMMRSEALAVGCVAPSIRSRNAPISTKFLEDPEITWRSARA